MIAKKIQYDECVDEESCCNKKLNIKIEMPTATMIPNKFFDDSKTIIGEIGVRGYAILLVVAKNEFALFKESDLSINELSEKLCMETEIIKEYCTKMDKKKYIKFDGNSIQL